MARRALCISLSLLALFLVGTVVVLSSVSYYLSIAIPAYITENEVPPAAGKTNRTSEEIIPRIIHQTWKTDILPERWQPVSQGCKDLMPDYEYMLWTDVKSREFIMKEYPWFLPTFDGYQYPIQRADAIRYFVLYHYGGIYLDLDVGCLRPLDPFLKFEVILPKTIPVGVSNDLMFAAKRHPFLEQTIHNLIAFDHSYVINYPTVMFSTGPMFLSAQFSLYTTSHPPPASNPGGEVRVLPKSLYGKNAKPGEAPHAFFAHFYGSSWHADEAGFILFLGKWGKGLMWVGLIVLVGGCAKIVLAKKTHRRRTYGRYRLLLPRPYLDKNGNYRYSFGLFSVPANFFNQSAPSSPGATFSSPPSPRVPLLPMSIDVAPPSPTSSTSSYNDPPSVAESFRRAGAWVSHAVSRSGDGRRNRRRGVLFFLPAIFTPSSYDPVSRRDSTSLDEFQPPARRGSPKDDAEFEAALLLAEPSSERYARSRSSSAGLESRSPSPPPYA